MIQRSYLIDTPDPTPTNKDEEEMIHGLTSSLHQGGICSLGAVVSNYKGDHHKRDMYLKLFLEWLRKTNRKPLLAAVEKMKEELMLLGFISLLLTATSSIIANICISSKFYNSAFAPCTRSAVDEDSENNASHERKLTAFGFPHLSWRVLNTLNKNTCKQDYEPFVSYEGLEQLHRFIFVMAITHISYSCLTMLLAVVKLQTAAMVDYQSPL